MAAAGAVALLAGVKLAGDRIHLAMLMKKMEPVLELPETGQRKIVCIGDSITFGAGVLDSRDREAWVSILKEELKEDYEVLNYGVCGATCMKESDHPYPDEFWQEAVNCDAEIYILMLGTNDSKPQNWKESEYRAQLEEYVRTLKEKTSGSIILMTPPPAFAQDGQELAVYEIDPALVSNPIRKTVLAEAKKEEVGVIDLYEQLDGHPEYFMDGVHPNAEGNQVIADIIRNELMHDMGLQD